MIAHVLDTSAILAHYLRESGAEDVNAILSKGPEASGISLITLVELRGRLFELESDSNEAERIFKLYTETLTTVLPFSRKTADAAMELRSATRPRLPLVGRIDCSQRKTTCRNTRPSRPPHGSNTSVSGQPADVTAEEINHPRCGENVPCCARK